MKSNRTLLCAALAVGVYALTAYATRADAQQTFLPPAFQPGAILSLNNDNGTKYTVLSQQGAWIRAQREGETKGVTEVWIYAPSGTVWTKIK